MCEQCIKQCIPSDPKYSKYQCEYLDYLVYFTDFANIQKKIIRLGKYKFNLNVFKILALKMKEKLQFQEGSIITYVPITWKRFCYRGFNQSKLLAKTIAKNKHIEVFNLLKRTNFHASLTTMNSVERKNETKQAFLVKNQKNNNLNKYKYCYLIDDVYTSGSTLNSAAKVLKEKYPHLKIIGICYAKTPKLFTKS